jgi:hypothetical protein
MILFNPHSSYKPFTRISIVKDRHLYGLNLVQVAVRSQLSDNARKVYQHRAVVEM